jgi:endoglucanase
VTTALWDTGLFIDRTTFRIRVPDLFALVQAGWKTRSGTGATDRLFVPESGPITAWTTTLNLNGLSFAG